MNHPAPARTLSLLLLLPILVALTGCSADPGGPSSAGRVDGPRAEWAIALHGGAGAIPKDSPADKREAYLQALHAALDLGRKMLDGGSSSLDTVEAVIRRLEDDPLFNAGKGAVFNHEGGHELDASVMDGSNKACGAVAGVKTVKNPIGLARKVMEETRHVLLAGPGAEQFADEMGVERVAQDYFFTQERWDRLQRILEEERSTESADAKMGTVGVAALDRDGNLAAGTSTGGLTAKKFGRVGDSPIVGAGTYADNQTCAVSGTGVGEEFIRRGLARSIAARMEFGGASLAEAANAEVMQGLEPGVGGIVAVSASGEIALVYNTNGMFRGAADSQGRFEVGIWEEMQPGGR